MEVRNIVGVKLKMCKLCWFEYVDRIPKERISKQIYNTNNEESSYDLSKRGVKSLCKWRACMKRVAEEAAKVWKDRDICPSILSAYPTETRC